MADSARFYGTADLDLSFVLPGLGITCFPLNSRSPSRV